MEKNNNNPSGFDEITNISENKEPEFNPTPIFQKNSQDNVTNISNEERIDKIMADFIKVPDADKNETLNSEPLEEAVEPEKVYEKEVSEEKTAEEKPDFIPSGTYSYSAAKGNLQSSAFETPETKAKEPKAFADEVVTPPVKETINKTSYIPNDFITSHSSTKKKNKKYGLGVVITAILLSAIIGAVSSLGALFLVDDFKELLFKSENSNQTTDNTPQNVTNITVDETVNSTVEAVAKKAGPSIVGIRTTAAVTNFFGGSSEATEEGSGIIYTTDGYIITNYHVIESAVEASTSTVEVFLANDTKTGIKANIVGYNISSDLAVVKVEKTGLPALTFTDSDKLQVGQYAIAIGNPGGLEFIGSVSYGIISGLNRSVALGTGNTMSLIQTDAAINPGNSGGALVDVNGQLIGVNSVKLVSESYEGMGFAIPANTVKEICDNIIAKENTPSPYIGIEISQTYTEQQLVALGYPAGAVVTSVTKDGPAAESGIQRGDIITELNGTTITNYTTFDNALAECEPGKSVTVKLYRAGRFYSTNINVKSNNAK